MFSHLTKITYAVNTDCLVQLSVITYFIHITNITEHSHIHIQLALKYNITYKHKSSVSLGQTNPDFS